MKRVILGLMILVFGIGIGTFLDDLSKNEMESVTAAKREGSEEKEILYWVAPMDPNYRRDGPGKSPMGMDLLPVYADSDDEGVVRIAPEVVNNLGVRTALVQRGRFSRKIDTVGYVNFDESKISHIHLRTEGWIHDLAVDGEGERVKKGELIFTLYSPTLVNAQEEYIQALASNNKNITQASSERLSALGLTKGQIHQLEKDRKVKQQVGTYAPQSGIVAKLNVRHGMFVKPENEVMALAGLNTVWIQAEVFERQANWVAEGHTAEARLSSMPGRVWKGKVDYVYPALDPVTRTLRVRLRFANEQELLKPNMYADVSIISEHTGPVIHIPRDALILDGGTPRVIIALGDGRFRSRAVVPGDESGDRVQIMDGLQEGEMIVVSAQFLIDSEASIKGSLRRMQALPVTHEQEQEQMQPMGTGMVNIIDTENRVINISHEAIEMLGWPAMTMDISTVDSIDLESIKPGDRVEFHLERDVAGVYVINQVISIDNGEQQHD